MKKLYHALFIVICGGVLLFLLRAPEVSTPRLPDNSDHADRKDYEACPTCHGADAEHAMPATHFEADQELRPDHRKCYFCHKTQES